MLEIGEVIDLRGPSRRDFLQYLGAAGIGSLGLKSAIGKVRGEEVEGEPIVWTRDLLGEPAKVRIIPEERLRRIKVYSDPARRSFIDETPPIEALKLKQLSDDEEDLAIQIIVDPDISTNERDNLPSEIEGVPTVIKERNYEIHNDCWDGTSVTPIQGNISVDIDPGGADGNGTLCFVGYNDGSANSDDWYECTITCWHLGTAEEPIYQEGDYVGPWRDKSTSMDGTKHEVTSVDARPLDTADTQLDKIEGVWDYWGLSDATSGSKTITGESAGRSTCYRENECFETVRNAEVDYQANFQDRSSTGGDSGSPWLQDSSSYWLIGMHQGYWMEDGDKGDRAIVAQELLDALEVVLDTP